jgi:hypothetical protein
MHSSADLAASILHMLHLGNSPSVLAQAAVMNMRISPDHQAVLEDLLHQHQVMRKPSGPLMPESDRDQGWGLLCAPSCLDLLTCH